MIIVTENIAGMATRGELVEQNGSVVRYIASERRYGSGEWRPHTGNVITTNSTPMWGCFINIEEMEEGEMND
jgi:hypothetical protein